MQTYTFTEQLVVEECCNCHMTFAMTQPFYRARRKDHGYFSCPAGHQMHYTGKSDEQKQRERAEHAERQAELARTQADFWQAEQERTERSRRALRGHITRMRNRIVNGVCPVPGCKRTGLTQTMRHIATVHPAWLHDHAEDLA